MELTGDCVLIVGATNECKNMLIISYSIYILQCGEQYAHSIYTHFELTMWWTFKVGDTVWYVCMFFFCVCVFFCSAEPLPALHGGAHRQTTIKVAAPPMYLRRLIAFLETALDAGGLVAFLEATQCFFLACPGGFLNRRSPPWALLLVAEQGNITVQEFASAGRRSRFLFCHRVILEPAFLLPQI